MSHLRPASITTLCVFGADVGSRLVRLEKWVDGMPSAVKSLGFEIWAACEVLCELASVIARAQRNYRTSFFNADAIKEIEEYLETCDEIFHEAARGVLVAYDRLKAIRPQPKQVKVEDSKEEEGERGRKMERGKTAKNQKSVNSRVAEVVCLSFQERAQWPLFQRRVGSMMSVLIDAKTDLTLHLLVYWTGWERESSRKSRSSMFAQLSTTNRDALIDQLWQNRARREQEAENTKAPTTWSSNASEGNATKPPSIFALSPSGSTSPDGSNSDPSSPSSTRSNDSLFKKISQKFSKSSKKSLIALGFITKKKDFDSEHYYRHNARSPAVSRSPSTTMGDSINWDQRSVRSAQPSLQRAQSARPPLRSERYSLLSLTNSESSMSRQPQLVKQNSWCAGPTKSAKEGILREWEVLRLNEDDLLWQSTEYETGESQDYRELGRQLLFRQLEAMIPIWAVQDGEQQHTGTIDMLVEHWLEPGQFRQRRLEWESIVDGRRSNSSHTHMTSDDNGRAHGAAPPTGNKFLFST